MSFYGVKLSKFIPGEPPGVLIVYPLIMSPGTPSRREYKTVQVEADNESDARLKAERIAGYNWSIESVRKLPPIMGVEMSHRVPSRISIETSRTYMEAAMREFQEFKEKISGETVIRRFRIQLKERYGRILPEKPSNKIVAFFQQIDNKVLPDVIYLLINSVARAALGATLVEGLGTEWRNTLQGYVSKNGKFTKFEVLYLPITPSVPVFWEYVCEKCWAFERPTLTCKWVTERGEPNPNTIEPQGWCVVWMPLEGDPPLSYLKQLPWFIREGPPKIP